MALLQKPTGPIYLVPANEYERMVRRLNEFEAWQPDAPGDEWAGSPLEAGAEAFLSELRQHQANDVARGEDPSFEPGRIGYCLKKAIEAMQWHAREIEDGQV